MRYAVCIPTLNSCDTWTKLVAGLRKQSPSLEKILIIDSESYDQTSDLAQQAGFDLLRISRSDFRHGATRQLGVKHLAGFDVIVFLTQDAILQGATSISRLVSRFEDARIAAAYGRQVSRQNAGLIEAHARQFNYPAQSSIRSLETVPSLGFKSVFFSNSFGAYRVQALNEVGGFPSDVDFGEDTVTAARLLLAGWKVAYAADAEVVHSHSYSLKEEYRRYFEIGKLHGEQRWMQERFGKPGGEGGRFVRSELSLLGRKAPYRIPEALLRACGKYLGYRSGMRRSLSSS